MDTAWLHSLGSKVALGLGTEGHGFHLEPSGTQPSNGLTGQRNGTLNLGGLPEPSVEWSSLPYVSYGDLAKQWFHAVMGTKYNRIYSRLYGLL